MDFTDNKELMSLKANMTLNTESSGLFKIVCVNPLEIRTSRNCLSFG